MREEGVIHNGEHTTLISSQEPGLRYTPVTTALHERDELAFVKLAKEAAADRSGGIPAQLLRRKLDQSGLDFSDAHGKAQWAAIERLGGGGRFGMVIAAAGAGKTAALKPLVAALKEQGREIYGASLAWRQADELVDAGIAKRNVLAVSVLIDRIGDDLGGEGPPPITPTRNTVIVIDEWATLGTRQGLELLRQREKYGFTLITLGDDKQTQAIEAGSVVDLSRRALGAEAVPVIVTTKRQQTAREQTIVGLLREGRAAEALTMKRQDGTAEMAYGGPDGVIQRVAKLYGERLATTGEAPTISAPTNLDAHRISEAVRLVRRDMGLVGPDLMTIRATDGAEKSPRHYDMKLAVGDHVRLFENVGMPSGKGGAFGRNGSVLEVVGVSASGLKLRNKSGSVAEVPWSKLDRNGRTLLAYGSAMTIHTAQGSTAKEHIFALPAGAQSITGASGYTASTRHRLVSYLVTSEMAERSAVRQSRPINDTHEITLDDKWANVARAMAYQPEQDSALAMIDRALKVKRWAIEGLRLASAPVGAPRSDVADSARLRHLGQAVASEARGAAQALRKGLERAAQTGRAVVSEGRGWRR